MISGEKILATLIDLFSEQHEIKVDYRVVKEESSEQKNEAQIA